MIIKVSKRTGDSSFGKLAKYISEEKREDGDRVAAVWTDGFEEEEEDIEVAAWQIEAKHKTKRGLDKDKTYHLIISFTPEEAKKLKEKDYIVIAHKTAESLDLGSHERITALHKDTDNPHLHLAINLLDDQNRYKEPFKAFVALKELRSELSRQYGFELPEGEKESDGSVKTKKYSNLTSFEDWAKENIKATEAAPTWNGLHTYLAKKGVSLRPRGAGFVLSHNHEKLFVKASSIDRNLSKGALEKRFGKYQEPAAEIAKVKEEDIFKTDYVMSKELFAEYQNNLKYKRAERAKRRKESKAIFEAEKKALSKSTKEAKQKAMTSLSDRKIRTGHLKRLTFERAQRMEALIEENQKRSEAIKNDLKHLSWKDYLLQEADAGNLTALRSLQKMKKDKGGENHIYNDDWKAIGNNLRGIKAKVKSNGDVIYTTKNKVEIRDQGKFLVVGEKFDDEKIDAALRVAQAKFGKTLHLNGTDEFLEAVKTRAEKLELNVQFADQARTFKANRTKER